MATHFKPPYVEDMSTLFVPTLNKTGYMTTHLDPYSHEFVEYAASSKELVLEIGAAFGVATLAALSQGAHIICNDIEPRHLKIVQQKANTKERERLIVLPGSFPDEINFPDNYFRAVLICRVLHLFDGEMVERSLAKIFRWLIPGGKLFVIVDTPYLKNIKKFIPEYEERLKQGVKWPGMITNLKEYVEKQDENLPEFVHVFDPSILEKILFQQGFFIEKINTLNRTDYPEDRRLDGRESVGAIAVKL